MHVEATAIVCAVRHHGEHGAIVRALTPGDGLLAGYVRGGRSRRLRPILIPGNVIRGEWRARTDEQLPALTVELIDSRAPLLGEPLPAAAIDWATALTATTLPEGHIYPHLHSALDGVLAAIASAPAAWGWGAALVRYELLLLAELGFGLDLSEEAAAPYRDRLPPLPAFLRDGGAARDWSDLLDGLRITGHFLERDLLHGRAADILAARERLVDRIKRMA